MDLHDADIGKLTEHFSRCIEAARSYLIQTGFNLDTKQLIIDTGNRKWRFLDQLLEGDLTKNLKALLPDGLSEDDLQMVLLRPVEKGSANSTLVVVNTHNYEVITCVGNE